VKVCEGLIPAVILFVTNNITDRIGLELLKSPRRFTRQSSVKAGNFYFGENKVK